MVRSQPCLLRFDELPLFAHLRPSPLLSPDPFTAENEMMTPKMSVKRHVVTRVYSQAIEKVYADAEMVASQKRAKAKDRSANLDQAPRPIPA